MERFERSTFGLSGQYSNQLNYIREMQMRFELIKYMICSHASSTI